MLKYLNRYTILAQTTIEEAFRQFNKAQFQNESVKQILSSLKSRKNFANSKSGATVIKATPGIQSKGAILDANDETYLILPDCSNT